MDRARLLKHFDTLADTPDAVAKLRSLVLNLAIKGDLRLSAPHETVDETYLQEPASETLPSHWRLLNFGKHCDIQGGNQPPKSKFLNHPAQGYVQLLQIRDLGTNPVPTYIPRESTNRFCKPGEILVGRYGASVGKVFWAKDGAYNVALAKFIYPTNAFIPEFAFLVLKSEFFQSPIAGASRSAQAGFNKGDLSSIDLPLPPLAEQKRIVARVEELLALCDELEARQTAAREQRTRLVQSAFDHLTAATNPTDFRRHAAFALQEFPHLTTTPDSIPALRQAILSLAVQGQIAVQSEADEAAAVLLDKIDVWRKSAIEEKRIRLPRKQLATIEASEHPYQLPSKWAWARLGQIIYIHSGDGLTSAEMRGGPIPVYGGNGVNGAHDTPNVFRPTIVIGRVGYYCGSIHVTPERAWVTDNAFITEYSADAIDQGFLVLLLRATNLKEDENATAQPVISGAKIYPIVIGLPPLAEQQRIVAKVAELMRWCDELEARLAAAQNAAAALLDSSLHALLVS